MNAASFGLRQTLAGGRIGRPEGVLHADLKRPALAVDSGRNRRLSFVADRQHAAR